MQRALLNDLIRTETAGGSIPWRTTDPSDVSGVGELHPSRSKLQIPSEASPARSNGTSAGSSSGSPRPPTFRLISFYTSATPYEEEIQRLRRSCQRFGIEPYIAAFPSRGSWVRNCSLKARFIRDQLTEFNQPVLWIDADGEVVAPLDLFNQADFDLGCYVRWSVEKEPPDLDTRDQPFMSGTVFVNHTSGGRRLASLWAQYCEAHPEVWDQVCLSWAWWDVKDEIRFRLLPQGYCKVADRIWREVTEIPFVLHYQASRRFKRLIKEEFPGRAGGQQVE